MALPADHTEEVVPAGVIEILEKVALLNLVLSCAVTEKPTRTLFTIGMVVEPTTVQVVSLVEIEPVIKLPLRVRH